MSGSARGIHAQMAWGPSAFGHDKENASRSPGSVVSRIRACTQAERKGPAPYGTTITDPQRVVNSVPWSETGQRQGAAHNAAIETAAKIGADRLRGTSTQGHNRSIEGGGGE